MVNYSVKVFARLKKEKDASKVASYEVTPAKDGLDNITFRTNKRPSVCAKKYKFHRVFEQNCQQSTIFEEVAKPVIDRVIDGYNGTIFAYGQTGSGKTYTITGSPKNYNDRGIIPRSLQYIFELNEKVTLKPTIYISYMEIYNENGYDLLFSKQEKWKKGLDALPKIALLENKSGEAHIRNLTVRPVSTEQEAMRLLFLGDTNRTIAETPMNENSSRSHCIFTIYMTFRDPISENMKFSKLHLVDLAGSERVSKTLSTGLALGEAKYINLSLHFLQQVILALTENKRTHIPYRNSMMTYILRDSLCGNCLTTMLATLAVTKANIDETISTCRFAQRVSLLTTDPIVNEIVDPAEEILFLRNRVEELEKRIQILTSFKTSGSLTEDIKERCRWQIKNYLTSTAQELKLEPDLTQIQFCFNIMKCEFETHKKSFDEHLQACEKSKHKIMELEKTVDKKEQEINSLKHIIDNIPEEPVNPKYALSKPVMVKPTPSDSKSKEITPNIETEPSDGKPLAEEDIQGLFEDFLKRPDIASSMSIYRTALEKKLEMAKICAEAIERCQRNILYLKGKLNGHTNESQRNILINELEEQQNIYKRALAELKDIQNETFHLQGGLEQAEARSQQKFEAWLEERNKNNDSKDNSFRKKCTNRKLWHLRRNNKNVSKSNENELGNLRTQSMLESFWKKHDYYLENSKVASDISNRDISKHKLSCSSEHVIDVCSFDCLNSNEPEKLIDASNHQLTTNTSDCLMKRHSCISIAPICEQHYVHTCVQCDMDNSKTLLSHYHDNSTHKVCPRSRCGYPSARTSYCNVVALEDVIDKNDDYNEICETCDKCVQCDDTSREPKLKYTSRYDMEEDHVCRAHYSCEPTIGIHYVPNYEKPIETCQEMRLYSGNTVFSKRMNYMPNCSNAALQIINEEQLEEPNIHHHTEYQTSQMQDTIDYQEQEPSYCETSASRTRFLKHHNSLADVIMSTDSIASIRIEDVNSTSENSFNNSINMDNEIANICPNNNTDNVEMDETSKSDEKQIKLSCLFKEDDTEAFKEFIKTIPLSGETELDKEIVEFYRAKFT